MSELKWTIEEKLGRRWERELLFLELPDDCPDPRYLYSVSDGVRSWSCQYDLERHALVLCADLEPGEVLNLRTADDTVSDNTLTVAQRRSGWHVANAYLGVDLIRDAAVHDRGDTWVADGPILFVTGPDGVPRGGSRVCVRKSRFLPHDREAIARVTPRRMATEEGAPIVETEMLANGPVFARYRYTLAHPQGSRYILTVTVYADYPLLELAEVCAYGHDGELTINVSENFPCDLYFFGGVDRERAELVPLPAAEYRLGSLSPHHTAMQAAYPWLGFVRSERPQGTFRGITDTSIEPFQDTFCFMGCRPWTWEYPHDVAPQFRAAGGRVTIQASIRRGRRDWFWFVTDRDVLRKEHRFGARQVTPFALWHRRLNDLPFEWVRRLDLEAGELAPGAVAASVLLPEEQEARRQGVFPELAQALAGPLEDHSSPALYARWVLLRDRAAVTELAHQVESLLEARVELFLNCGFLTDAASAVAMRMFGPAAVYYEACCEADVFAPAERRRLHRLFILLAYASEGDALFPCHHNYQPPQHPQAIRNWALLEQYSDVLGTPNFQTDVYYNLGLFGCVFRDHPRAAAWRQQAAEQLHQQLDQHFHPGGVYEESIGYFTHLFHNMLALASALRRHGERDFYADRRFQDAMNTLVDYLGAPRRPTPEQQQAPEKAPPAASRWRYWPAIGDTGHNCLEAPLLPLIAHAGWEVRSQHPALSDKLLAAWQECGRPLWGAHPPQFEFLYVQGLRVRPPKLALTSRQFTNCGLMLRADVGLPSETSLFVRSGRATHHWGFDHGHFTLTTRGSLLIPDLGYHARTQAAAGPTFFAGWSWFHSPLTFGAFENGYTGMERRAPERTVAIGNDFDYVVVDISINNVRQRSWRNVIRLEQPIEYFRHVLFAHNRYVLVWDRVAHSVYPSQLRIPCLARGLKITGQRLHFQGVDDVDLLVTIVQPEKTEIEHALIGPQHYALLQQDCELDYLWVCQPLGPNEEPFRVTAEPGRVVVSGRDLHHTSFSDEVLFAHGDRGQTFAADDRQYLVANGLAVLHSDDHGRVLHALDARPVT